MNRFFLSFFMLCCIYNNSFAQKLIAKQKIINSDYSLSENNKKKANLGIDIGGTKIDWAVYPIEDKTLIKKPLISGTINTPKGVEKLANSYYKIVLDAIKKANQKKYSIINIGVGSPGRFVEHKKQTKILTNEIISSIGDPFVVEKSLFLISQKNTIAAGTAVNLGENPDDFDNVVLESLFQRLSPKKVKVTVRNDAAVQLQGLVTEVDLDKVAGKKIVYIGPGTGLGTAVMSSDGKIVTDGHFQYIELNKIEETQADKDVFDIIRKNNLDKYNKINPESKAITPEDIFSGVGIGNILKETFNLVDIPRHFDDLFIDKKDDANFNLAQERLKSIGKYFAYFLINIYNAEFKHLDINAEWSDADKLEIKDFETIIFGGGLATESKFFKDVILDESKKILADKKLDTKIIFVLPKQKKAIATYAAASLCGCVKTIEKPAVALTFDDGPNIKWTHQVLDLLKKYHIKATFFVIGENIGPHQDILKRIAKEGHVIGVHTFTHPDLTKLSDEKVKEEITKTIDAIHKVLPDYKIKFMRPPYGSMNEKIKKIILSLGLKPILWSASGNDYLAISTAEYIKKNIDSELEKYNGGIVLLHDGGGDFEDGIPVNKKFRDGKQNVIDYLTLELPNLVEKYTLITIE